MEDGTVQLLVFDMGKVLVDFDWDEICAGFCRSSRKSSRELRHVFYVCSALGYESGNIDTAGFLAELNRALGTEMSFVEFKALWVATFRENAEMADLLTTLKEQCPLYLLSNTNQLHFDHLEEEFKISRHFQEVLLSYQLGCVKPDPPIYEEVLRRSGLSAPECLFVDDLESNVRGAEAVGLKAIHFKGVSDLKQELSAFGFRV
jgi:glucose-1-phosphatase